MYPTRDALNIVLSYLASETTSCALLGDHPIMGMPTERMTLDMTASLPGTCTFRTCTCRQTASACLYQARCKNNSLPGTAIRSMYV